MKSLYERQLELYERWKSSRDYKVFVYDGILNINQWENENLKILFLLKESNDDFTQIAGNTIDIRKGNGPHFWWNICYWKYLVNGIHNGHKVDFIAKSELPEAKFNNFILNGIAYLNIKKQCDNNPHSNDADILKYAQNDKEFLKEQIELINPDIIFCSQTTFKSYKIIYPGEIEEISHICFKHKGRLIINFYHPSYGYLAGGREAIFNNLKDALISKERIFDQLKWSNK